MSSEAEQDKNQEILREIRSGREFTLGDFIAKEGSDFLRGESPVPRLVQVVTEINTFIAQNLSDPTGALQFVLQSWVSDRPPALSKHLDSPLKALEEMIERVLNNPEILYELVRKVDFRSGQITGKRPHFQMPGQEPHPDDEYTHDSVTQQLKQLLEKVKAA
ncbi:hypothetical protein [Gloeocapsa sp. PCC 73106]|uniref:hypothetical protein n=1 Tax=Gloeocapsa sp. PCC 73106 TaxID=102232 RepID=UPI0002AC8A1C|nr:hypothetical protein [Gloeocapsa sp. PCC 73106]ELR99831.1 hypothetical protein GLO73106DRAFT_00036830 [Gloeocapsa sp. PCC 73106]